MSTTAPSDDRPSGVAERDCLVELRVLDGPNVHLARPALQVRLQVQPFMDADDATLRIWLDDAGLVVEDLGEPGSDQRLRTVHELVAHVAARLADRGGVRNLHCVTAPGWEPGEVILAFPWRRLTPAERLGRYVAYVLEDLGTRKLPGTLAKVTRRLRTAEDGERPWVPEPHVPTVGITGTNGKTTTTRMIGNLLLAAGRRTAWNSTDGVYVEGVLVDDGDWAGFGGAGRVLETPRLDVAVLEIARGGLLRRGLGVRHLDVAVVTNVSPDHLGELGVHTLDDLARVKGTIVRVVRRDGWAVLNVEDPRVLAMRELTEANLCGFALDPDAPGLAEIVAAGGRGLTVDGGAIVVREGEGQRTLVDVRDVPATLGGLSHHNLANALAATGALLALGLDDGRIADGLRGFVPDADANPGRLNVWQHDGRTILVDIAHNQESLEAMLGVARGLTASDGQLWAITGTIGDRTDEIIGRLGELTGSLADRPVFAEKAKYLRGRDGSQILAMLQTGAARGAEQVGRPLPDGVPVHADELDALDAVLAEAKPGDVVALAVHVHLGDVSDHLRALGATIARADQLRPAD